MIDLCTEAFYMLSIVRLLLKGRLSRVLSERERTHGSEPYGVFDSNNVRPQLKVFANTGVINIIT